MSESSLNTGNGRASLEYSVDGVDGEQWHDIVGLFSDATIHQTGSWGKYRWGEDKLSRIVITEGGDIVAAAQLVVVTVPIFGAGIAHCKFGPMWRRRGREERPEVYISALRGMREAFAVRRKLLLRVKPWELEGVQGSYAHAREAAGMAPRGAEETYDTFVVDMSGTLDELRAGLASKWRYNLKKSERRNLEIRRGNDAHAADLFMQNYAEMRSIKSYVENSEVDILPALLEDLPAALKPAIFTAMVGGQPAASIVISHIGDVAYYLFGATGRLGRETGASYVLFWNAIEWLKERSCRWFDLVGSRPAQPNGQRGYRQFKAGLVGKNGDEFSMRDWQVCGALTSRIVVGGGEWARNGLLELMQRADAAQTWLRERAFSA